jgi:hypothetical protein
LLYFKKDEKTHDLTKTERLEFHQEYSKPIMEQLHAYLTDQLDTKQVEPNDSLGRAIRYMLKH